MNVAHEEMTPHTVLSPHFTFLLWIHPCVPSLLWNSRAKSTLFDNVPVTWYLPGLCGSVKQTMGFPAPHRCKTHKKQLIRVNPENEGSSPFGCSCPPNCGTRQTIAPDPRCRQCFLSTLNFHSHVHRSQIVATCCIARRCSAMHWVCSYWYLVHRI